MRPSAGQCNRLAGSGPGGHVVLKSHTDAPRRDGRWRRTQRPDAAKQRTHPVPSEFYLIIFLLASTLIFAFFYATRASHRGRVLMSKVKHREPDKPHGADAAH